MRIGEKLQLLRKLKNYTQEEIALKLNMERRSYANLENNTTKADFERLSQIAKIYGIEVDELLNFDENKAFDIFFSKNVNYIFSPESSTSEEIDQNEFFKDQIHLLINEIRNDRKIVLEAIENLRNELAAK